MLSFGILIIFVLLLASGSMNGSPEEKISGSDRERIAAAVQWSRDWVRPVGVIASNVVCRGERSGAYGYVFCEPDRAEVDLWHETLDGDASMVHISQIGSLVTAEKEAPLRFGPGWSGATGKITITLTPIELAKTRVKDSHLTQVLYSLSKRFVEKAVNTPGKPGLLAYYPWVNRNDPEYRVYVTSKGRLVNIWAFVIVKRSISEYSNTVYDVAHQSIPQMAEASLQDGQRWYLKARLP